MPPCPIRKDVPARCPRAVEPCDCPAVEGESGEHVLVAQWGKELVLIDKRLAVEDDAATVVEVQLQQVVARDSA